MKLILIEVLEQLKSGFKRTIYCFKLLSKVSLQVQKRYLDFLINLSFQGVDRFLVLTFENIADRTAHTYYYIQKVEIKDDIVMIDGRNFFDQPVKNNTDLSTLLCLILGGCRIKCNREKIIKVS